MRTLELQDTRRLDRLDMVKRQVAARGVRDPRVLEAMRVVPREAFIAPELADAAYDDRPLPIGAGQTISQPYVVALMIEALALRGGERVLEIGTGSGYAAAVLSRIAGHVYTVERHASFVEAARRRFHAVGLTNIDVMSGDGSLGWVACGPYDAIVVTAGGPGVPRALRNQLVEGGRLVMPIGPTPRLQQLVRETRCPGHPGACATHREWFGEVRFVPLVGAAAWTQGVRGVRGAWSNDVDRPSLLRRIWTPPRFRHPAAPYAV